MAQFTVVIEDASKLAGITAARNAHNAEYPDAQISTDEAFVQFVMERAAQSYARQFGV